MTRYIATFLCVGYLRPAPGTWGSLAALPVAYLINMAFGPLGLALAILAAFLLGWWATQEQTAGRDDHDPSEIVIDEVVGQWIALLPVMIGAYHAGADVMELWPGWVTAFLAFRFFDITKPGPIGTADRRGDALGVMLDDVLAGIAAALTVGLFAYIAHGILGA